MIIRNYENIMLNALIKGIFYSLYVDNFVNDKEYQSMLKRLNRKLQVNE